MSTAAIAFLRAVNVAGKGRLAMADFRRALTALGLEAVETVAQTGNAVFRAVDLAGLEARVEAALADRFGLDTTVLVRTAAHWAETLRALPFPEAARDMPARLVVMPLTAVPPADAVDALQEIGSERVAAVGDMLFVVYPDGIGRSRLTTALIERRLGVRGTQRNWNTALLIAEAAARHSAPSP
ncbi:DUF1697 domain-containing protein [Acuticoccus mangrovi]|uniref:DUF1697 domain-containing protein n=1 Tax=Acuticoccus mangrovi TaxID=2796142 RepID=A0A934INP8_9HYPH|nr:DUF1697 domain-containing protein [Acuticoccus mangrovi]MBJ3777242.1 DUF1697 domain-containing protein [Acuticoccus mangrovi]